MLGQVLGHYQVIDQLGTGGMGVVYRARDTRLERDVALKVLPAGLLADAAARKRFRNEALALARLNHPNICSVFDFDTQDGIDFLVMEFVTGTSLHELLAKGSLPLDEVPRLGAQLAGGLYAAHTQGVLHRDLKPGNLRITPDGRLKILDFGLAKLFHPDATPEATLSVNDTSSFSGTVPYMAPEQLRNDPPDLRMDIYSAGAVLYECATGQRPYPERQLAKLIDAILHRNPTPVSQINNRISPGLETVIHKAMDRRAEQRYQSAREMQIDLERLEASPPPLASRPPAKAAPFPIPRAVAFVFLLILVAGIGMGVYMTRRHPARAPVGSTRPIAVAPRRSVAVLGFKNLSAKPESTTWLSTALSEMLTTELSAGERLRAVPSENIARMKTDLALLDQVSYAPDTLRRIRSVSGSDAVIFGSYVVLEDRSGGKIRVDLHIQDTQSGETLFNLSESGNQGDLLEVVSRLGSRLRSTLGLPAISTDEANRVRASLPNSPATAQLYAEGLEKLRVFDSVAARDLLQKAAQADPSNALIQSALAVAWGQLGYDEKAREAAKHALDLSANLSREEHLNIEARYRESVHEYDREIEIYKALRDFFPDNLEYLFRLVMVQVSAGKPKDALATLEQLRASSPAAVENPRFDLAEASAADVLTNFKQEQAAAAQAAAKAKLRGERLTQARALLLEGSAWQHLGDNAKAAEISLEAKSIYEAAGDRVGVARSLHNLGNIAKAQSNLNDAEKYFQQSIAIRREIQDNIGLARALNDSAVVRELRGDLGGAAKLYEESLSIARKVGDKGAIGSALGNLGNISNSQGHPAEARKRYEEAAVLFRETGNKDGLASVLANLGVLADGAGNSDEAGKLLQESASMFEQIGNQSGLAQVRTLLASHFYDHGDFALARSNFQESADAAAKVGDRATQAEAQTFLAGIDRLQGDMPSALSQSEAALATAREIGDVSIITETTLSRATVLLVTGDLAGARQLVEQVVSSMEKGGDQRYLAEALEDRGEMLLFQDDLAGAARDYAKSFALRQQLKDTPNIIGMQMASARLALEERQPSRAAALAREALLGARAGKSLSVEARSHLLLARALFDQPALPGSIAEAKKSLAAAAPLIEKNPTPDLRLILAMLSARARVAASSSEIADAAKALEAALAELAAKSSYDVQLDARLLVAELQLKSGTASTALPALAAIEKEAASHGFLLFARKAKSLAASAHN
ncbi:MAG: tetratricopeptide repeat protein [Candidatus Acidiferrum sp.]